eukprot:CAMPEP_0114984476 /NCGR_PEP_ID=MMETSP0216-20121206/7297_1 /TAXON_ID=223996 /ORGANISM="Protocruzia adherens, Strain Boccale" /LENGTH=450 /DNA_ID=CAMNT_0002346615 /DNA_START=327 /DNA_END=1679 /DNA_ORIENTATION=+
MNCYRSVVKALRKCSKAEQSESKRSKKEVEDELERVEPLHLRELHHSKDSASKDKKSNKKPQHSSASEEMTDTSSEKHHKDDPTRSIGERGRDSVDSGDISSLSGRGIQIVVTDPKNSQKKVFHHPHKPEESYLSYISKVIKIQCFIRSYLNRKRSRERPTFKTNHSINVEEIKAELRDEIASADEKFGYTKFKKIGTAGSGESSVSSLSYTTDEVGFGRQPRYMPKREIGNNVFYDGEWRDSLKWGKGKITWPNGSSYDGGWKNDQAHGRGNYSSEFGEGFFSDSVSDCTLKNMEGVTSYIGAFKHHFKHGEGIEKYATGRMYEGKFKHGKRHGFGVMTFLDNSKYIGQFKANVQEGVGTYESFDGDKYEGEFRNDAYHGRGKLVKANGSSYTGEFSNGKFHGTGEFSHGGKIYKGNWINGNREGEFRVTSKKGKAKKMVYKNDKRCKD